MQALLWVLQKNMKNRPALTQIRDVLNSLSLPFVEIDLMPFFNELDHGPIAEQSAKIICWGPSFVPRVNNHPLLTRGIWFDQHDFKWSTLNKHWPSLMMNSEVKVQSFDQALRDLGPELKFMRPDLDSKAFDGGLYDAHTPPKLRGNFPADLQTITAPVLNVEDEWRFFVVNGRIVGRSSYRIADEPRFDGDIPERATQLIEDAIRCWSPAPVVCIDVGFDGKRFGIVEANCFNASRLYGANVATVISEVNNYVRSL